MPTLTAEQITDFRMLIGDELATENEISDADIRAQYDKAHAFGADADTTEARTVVYLLRRLLGLQRRLMDKSGDIQNERHSQLFEHIKDMLKYWEDLAGMTGGASGTLSVGVLNLGIDYTQEDYDAQWDS